jgi:hypothetical protein
MFWRSAQSCLRKAACVILMLRRNFEPRADARQSLKVAGISTHARPRDHGQPADLGAKAEWPNSFEICAEREGAHSQNDRAKLPQGTNNFQ